MKVLISAMSLFFAANAYASCPNLIGTFMCEVQGESGQLAIAQKVDKGTSIYTFTVDPKFASFIAGGDLIADGKPHATPASKYMKNGTYVATCRTTNLGLDVKGDVLDDTGAVLAKIDIKTSLSTKPGMLIVGATGTLNGDDIGNQSLECKKIK